MDLTHYSREPAAGASQYRRPAGLHPEQSAFRRPVGEPPARPHRAASQSSARPAPHLGDRGRRLGGGAGFHVCRDPGRDDGLAAGRPGCGAAWLTPAGRDVTVPT